MNDLNDFLSKLDNVNFTKTDGRKAIIGTPKEGDTTSEIRVSYSIEMANSRVSISHFPFQVVIHISVNGHYGTTWGCTSNEDNGVFAAWFLLHYNKAQQSEFHQEEEERYTASEFIESLGVS